MALNNSYSLRLPDGEYFPAARKKSGIAIHPQNAEWWREQKTELLAVDSLRVFVAALQDSIATLHSQNTLALQTGYDRACGHQSPTRQGGIVITPTRKRRDLTDVELEYLWALADGERKGKDMRERLRECGVYEDRMKFYRVMQWLKQTGHVEAERIARDEGEYRGSQ